MSEATPTPTTTVPGSPEYNAAMIARADAAADPKTFEKVETGLPVPHMPEGGSEKFYDPKTGQYNWQAHVKELEWKLNGGKKEPEAPAEAPKEGEAEKPQEVPAGLLETLGLKEGDLGEAIASKGDIPEAARKALTDKGIPSEWIDEFVDNAKYRITAEEEKMFSAVGGKAGWQDLSGWAAENLSEQEKVTVNAMLGDPRLISQGMEWLKARRAQANPLSAEGSLVSPAVSPAAGTTGFANRAEQSRAINDPRYRTDPAYREQVQRRMMLSTYSRERSF